MADQSVVKLPAKSVLEKLAQKAKTARASVADVNGKLGSDIAKAVDDHNLHAGAFKLVAKLSRMDPVKLNAYLTHFDDYRTKLGLDDLAAASIPGMEEGGEKKPPEPMFKDGDPPPSVN